MKVNAKNLPRHDLIGLCIRIVDAKNKSLVGLEGEIVNETRNMIEVDDGKKTRKIMKSQIKIEVEIQGKKYEVDGRVLVGRPEDRIKKIRRLK